MPLIKNFTSTNVWKAFLLNSVATSMIVILAIEINDFFDDNDKENKHKSKKNKTAHIIINFLTTLVVSMLAYTIMYFIFGFGGGMLA